MKRLVKLSSAASLVIALSLAAAFGPALVHAQGYLLEPITEELIKPVSLVALDDGRLLVSQLDGQVVVVEDGVVRAEPFLNLVGRVTALAGEQGLFSAALEPRAAAALLGRAPLLIAAFTERDTGDLLVAAYPTDDLLTKAHETEERILLRVAMPEPFHHGGQVAFGPDGLLYVSVGNGESSNSFLHSSPWSSQSLDLMRGKLLRLDLSGAAPGQAYAVPEGNPFVTVPGARPEIYALGLRNPWKFTFSDADGRLLLVDVGNDRWEEVNEIEAGGNYGWPAREGPECQAFPDAPGLVDADCQVTSAAESIYGEPLTAYGHLAIDPAGGQAVTGGVVVLDLELPRLRGRYLFGDFVVGRIWSLDLTSGAVDLLLDTELSITQLAAGPNQEVLVLSISGELFRLVYRPE